MTDYQNQRPGTGSEMSALAPLLHTLTALELSETSALEAASMIARVNDWPAFLAGAENHGLAALILKHAREHPLDIPQDAMLGLKSLALRHRAIAGVRREVLAGLLQRFNAAACPVIVLKGIALAELVYPRSGLRPMRDIDILVPRKQAGLAAEQLRRAGFTLPDRHADRYNRDSHQLPDAWKMVSGFRISVEIHLDAVERDAPGHLYFEDISRTQSVRREGLAFDTLGHEQMLHQLCRHLQGRHPGGRLKLINVLDIVLYGERFINDIDWNLLSGRYPEVLNTLKCLHLVTPLSAELQDRIGGVAEVSVDGVGETMPLLKDIVRGEGKATGKFRKLVAPADWWLHLYYGVPPGRSLLAVKLWRHPLALIPFIGKRAWSRIMGG